MSSCEIVSPGSCFSALAKQSWQALEGNWLIAIGAFLMMVGIQGAANSLPIVQFCSGILLVPLQVGMLLFMLHIIRKDCAPDIFQLFGPFSQYWRYVWAYLRIFIFTFLWTLLLIIPGIVAGYRYSMTFYIMLDNPQYTAKEAMTESCAIMYGHKLQLFGYGLLIALIFMAAFGCTITVGVFWALALNGAFFGADIGYGWLIAVILLAVVLCLLVLTLFRLIVWATAFNTAFYDSIRRRPVEPPAGGQGAADPEAGGGPAAAEAANLTSPQA